MTLEGQQLETWLDLAETAVELGEYQEAVTAANQALTLQSDLSEATAIKEGYEGFVDRFEDWYASAIDKPSGIRNFIWWLIKMEDNMEILALLGQFLVGVGVVCFGIAAIWFVSVYADKDK